MAATPTSKQISLKLLIDKKSKKVVFAEAKKDFVDFLFNLLSLPVGTVIRLLKTPSMVGCIGNLYKSLEKLDEAYMQPYQSKDSLLKPAGSTSFNIHALQLELDTATGKKFYGCSNYHHRCISEFKGARCSYCASPMTYEPKVVGSTNVSSASAATTSDTEGLGGYVKDLVTYMVTDDLEVSPMSMISGVALFNEFGIMGFGTLEEKKVEFGLSEGLQLLRASLQSNAALTTVFLAKHEVKDGGDQTEVELDI